MITCTCYQGDLWTYALNHGWKTDTCLVRAGVSANPTKAEGTRSSEWPVPRFARWPANEMKAAVPLQDA